MKIIKKLLVGLALLVGLVIAMIAVGALWLRMEDARNRRRDAPFVEEGHRSAERFLQTNSAPVLRAIQATNPPGDFVRLEGTGFAYPVWNIQGYDFLSLQRTAVFSGGSIPIRVIVTSGTHKAGGKLMGVPQVKDGMIFVHVRDEESPESKAPAEAKHGG